MVVLSDVADASLIRFLSGGQWRREHGECKLPATPAREPYRDWFRRSRFKNGVPQGEARERRAQGVPSARSVLAPRPDTSRPTRAAWTGASSPA
jgi:hypothetical protein